MTARRLGATVLVGAVVAGCGAAGGSRVPDPAQIPLVKGTSVVAKVRQCDGGANAYCSVEEVVVGPGYRNSEDLVMSERAFVYSLGWTGANADTGDERAADSPGHKLRLTYATAYGDLKGIDLGWIQRSRAIALALSHAMFNRTPAMSVMLEIGST